MKYALFSGLLLCTLFSCTVPETITLGGDETNGVDVGVTSIEFSRVNKLYNEVATVVEDVVEQAEDDTSDTEASRLAARSETSYPRITVSPFDNATFPKTIKIEFGNAGVTGVDGVTRKGTITTVSTGWYTDFNSIHTTVFTNYHHDNNKIEGTHIVTNNGENEDGYPEMLVEVNNGRVLFEDGSVVTYTKETTRTTVEGSNTPYNIWDNEYAINGWHRGVNSGGLNYEFTTLEDLNYVIATRSLNDGLLNLDLDDLTGITIDYEDYTITFNGYTYSFVD